MSKITEIGSDNPQHLCDTDSHMNNLMNVNGIQTKLVKPMASTSSLLSRARMFLPQIAEANKAINADGGSFVEIIDKNAGNAPPSKKKSKNPMIEMNIAMGVIEKKQNPVLITSLDDEGAPSEPTTNSEEFNLRMPNSTEDILSQKAEQDNERAVSNIMNALFDPNDHDEDSDEDDDSEEDDMDI
ncbi:protein transport protein SEC13 [Acrasis kona]|uniref:Protein transport protein SEC13 n=1 Tax=Acrasis kona TaxID=1008807 RepID=A0AAW2ZEA8_9EUKA